MRDNAPIDRETHCPFLLRVFCSTGGPHRKEDFEKLDENPIEDELHIYTWPDATLREIADLVQDSNSDARRSSARMGFSIVSQIRDGRIVMRKVGWVNSNRRKTGDEDKTLAALRFEPGDYLDVA
uniref:Histone deacetylase complex subunit SAP18 n=1 Tax=Globisporangium ultimum (strain ATCC 200006 / CBS 805.95 / DAOM BR144) TaxID=431595 RepID=K3WSX0_GLOUD